MAKRDKINYFQQIDDDIDSIIENIMLSDSSRSAIQNDSTPEKPAATSAIVRPSSETGHLSQTRSSRRISNHIDLKSHPLASKAPPPQQTENNSPAKAISSADNSNNKRRNNPITLPSHIRTSTKIKNTRPTHLDTIIANHQIAITKNTVANPSRRSVRAVDQRKIGPQEKRPENTRGRSRKIPTTIAFFAMVAVLAGLQFKDAIYQQISPATPFSNVLGADSLKNLYYPTKLPAGFKIEAASINSNSSNVVLYAISNDANQSIIISTQQKPPTLDLKPLENTLIESRVLNTKYGSIKFGIAQDNPGVFLANVIIRDTWIMISQPKATNITDAQLIDLIDSFRR